MQNKRRTTFKPAMPSPNATAPLPAVKQNTAMLPITPRKLDSDSPSKEDLEPQKNKTVVVEGMKPNPDINNSTDILANTMQIVGGPDMNQNTELKSGDDSNQMGGTFQNIPEINDEGEPMSLSSIIPTPRDAEVFIDPS